MTSVTPKLDRPGSREATAASSSVVVADATFNVGVILREFEAHRRDLVGRVSGSLAVFTGFARLDTRTGAIREVTEGTPILINTTLRMTSDRQSDVELVAYDMNNPTPVIVEGAGVCLHLGGNAAGSAETE